MATEPVKKTTPPAKSTPSLSSFLDKKDDKAKADEVGTRSYPTTTTNVRDDEVTDLPIGPDSDKKDVVVKVDNEGQGNTVKYDEEDIKGKPGLSRAVTSTVPNKTPAELAAETPDETAERYGIDNKVSEEDLDNPRVQVYRDTLVNQVPSGTHLHPDVAKDLMNRGVAEQHTDNAQVKRMITDTYAFAPDAEHQDKFDKSLLKNDSDHDGEFDRDEDYVDENEDREFEGSRDSSLNKKEEKNYLQDANKVKKNDSDKITGR